MKATKTLAACNLCGGGAAMTWSFLSLNEKTALYKPSSAIQRVGNFCFLIPVLS
jgi:hypothetical protein